ncbi:MAG: transcriptional regulator [Elusimicrobia bacterium GWC2_51_8]|nr:MAG: transcriptional regulator [Elusimicrobia bacterium GWA2_51_34]OGR61082.1 MAG: transcriptional regulator [Elusimicrobia bacterium GWC2_51_8]OGR87893.1 MAG: transcriptional regulator [Elusimicrobia bacterium GWF2_52_66]HAF95710.1 transcriptional regulator [Elusimicrobiota bacterium]HCE97033.1 transcriptional regulator [Elusimicrobiota bacterium]
MERLVNKIRILRAEKDISQETLSKAVGVSRQTVVAIEGGGYSPSVALALKIARYFGKPMEEVFTIEDA